MMKLSILLFCYAVLMDSYHVVSSCSYYVSVGYQTSYVGYYAIYTSCGWWGRRRCRAGTRTMTQYTTTYYLQLLCCSGYGPKPNCPPICNPSCGTNKECSAPNTCTCASGWTGSMCFTPICNSHCGTNKECTAPDTCTCINGWTGNDCLTAICNSQCGTNKKCTAPNTCTCVNGWTGNDCLTAICSPQCGTNKQCTAPDTCTCASGWSDDDCSTAICSTPCGTNKQCTAPDTCTCVSGWTGSNCLTDINECSQNLCHHQCTNTNGSYYCSCDTSTVLAKNGIHCLGAIQDMTFSHLSSIHCLITWNPPFQYMQYGSFNGYIVMCNISNTNTIIASNITQKLYITAQFLKPYTSYICCVTPQWTTSGIGKTLCINFTTLQDAPDDSPVNVTVSVVNSSSLQIQWDPPLIPNGIITHYTLYLNYTNGSDISTKSIDSQFIAYHLEELKPYQQVGISISATTSGGEGPQSDYVYNTTEQTEPGIIHQLTVNVLSNSSVNISWQPPLLSNGVILHYNISIRSLTVNQSVIFESEKNLYHIIHDLSPFTPYEVNVSAVSIAGIGVPLHKVFFTKETVPRVAPNIELALRVSPIEIIIKIKPLTLEEGRGIVTGYTFNLTKSIDHCVVVDMNELLIHTLNTSIKVGNLDPLSKYCLSVSAQTKEGHGLESQNILIPVLIYTSPNQTSNNETNTKNKVILFSAVGSASGLSLFLCFCCTIISVCIFKKFKSKRNYKFIPREHKMQGSEDDDEDHYHLVTESKFHNEQYFAHDNIDISPNSVGDSEDYYGDIITTENSFKKPLLPTKFSQWKVKESSCTSTATSVFDSPTITGTETSILQRTQKTPLPPVPPVKKASKNGTLDVEHYEIPSNYGYGKGMTAERKPLPPVPPPMKASKHGTLDVEHFETQSNYSYDKGMTAKRKPLPPIPPPTKASKHGTLDVEHFETQSNYGYGKGMTAKRKPLPPIPPPTKASKHETLDVEHFETQSNYGYGKGITAKRKPLPPIPSPTKASKHGTLDVEHFETQSNYGYSKGMTAKRKPLPPILPPMKASKQGTSDAGPPSVPPKREL